MEQAFIQHIEKNKNLIYKVCHVYEAREHARRDLFQEIVVQLWRAFPNYNPAYKWTTWAYRIALNTAITQRRKSSLNTIPFSGLLQNEWEQKIVDRPEENGEDERIEALHQAIAQLNPVEKALVLLYLDNQSYSDMAEIVGLSENNVGVRLNRVKSKLKSILLYGKS